MRTLLLAFFGCFLSLALSAQTYWQFVPEEKLDVPGQLERHAVPDRLLTLKLDFEALEQTLKSAPLEYTSGSPVVIDLPAADGYFRQFEVWESPVMAPALAAQHPETRTYSGRSADGFSARLVTGPLGFHAFMLAPDGSIETVRPYSDGQKSVCMVYHSKDLKPRPESVFQCASDDFDEAEPLPETRHLPKISDRGNAPVKLKKYRIAIAAMGEYTAFHGGTKTLANNAIVVALTYINTIFERDFAARLELIPNNSDIIFLDKDNDPFTGNQTSGFMNQNPGAIDPIIGSGSYDIGHVFGVYFPGNKATGVAIRSGACTGNKGRGCSTASPPTGDYFYKVAAHEICHQLSGTHTWNNCSEDYVDQRSLETVFEPGSGSTLMSYAGGCGPNNVLADNDPYFHLANMIQVQQFIASGNGSTCGTEMDTDNNTPTASIPLNNDFFIPISTPFQLSAEGSDTDGDQLRYCWEQWDRDTVGLPVDLGVAGADGALFRSFTPSTSPARVFPRLSLLLANQSDKSEVLPTVSRPLTFRVSVRDYHPGGGAFAWDEVKFRSTNLAGPFTVSSPNELSDVWLTGEYQTVVWDVANTDRAPVNCKTVNIRLSTDGGQTYPLLLASGVPNSGRACVKVPAQVTNIARVRVEAADNIFFDISNSSFKIQTPAQPAFSLCTERLIDTVCLPAAYTATINSSALSGFSDPINLVASTDVPGAVVSFNTSALTPGSDAVLTIEFPVGNPDGDFNVVIGGAAAGLTDSVQISLHVVSNNFTALAPIAPADGAAGQDQAAVLRWNKVADANVYDIQVASSPAFAPGDIIATLENTTLDSFKLPVIQDKGAVVYWRIRPENECGAADWFGPYSYAVVVNVCQTFESTDVPKNITANGTPTVESKITVPAGGIVNDVNITKIQGNHTFFRDLEMHLISPAGTDVLLFKDKCPNFSGNFNFGFDDSKLNLFGCPPPNNGSTSKPTDPLSAMNNQPSGGDWILRVKDNTISSGGQITGFALELCSSASLNPPVLVNNNQMQLPPGTNKAVTVDLLKTEDANNSDDQLLYTLTMSPKYGELQFNWGGVKLQPGAQFTQADLNNGSIRYFDYGFSGKQDQFCFTVTDGEGGLIADCFVIQPFPLVDAPEADAAFRFLLAPNPASELLRIVFEEAPGADTRIRLFDASGRLVRELMLASGQTVTEINVAHLPGGMYTVTAGNAQGSGVRKVMVR